MRKLSIALAIGVLAAAPSYAAPDPIGVMVLGAYHFGNPGLDVNNVNVDSVLTPEKQAELDAVASALLKFKPTHVMVEMQSEEPDFAAKSYQTFTPERLKTEANEIEQIGFRVAKMAGLKVVHAIDEQPKDGEPDYFPYDKLQETAAKFGQTGVIERANAQVVDSNREFELRQKTETVAQLLAWFNSPNPRVADMAFYYDVLSIGDANTQSGADLNAMWYLRNAKIFGKLARIVKPRDRVLVIYGAGHNFWLRHFSTHTPGFRNVDPVPYLKRAKVRR